MSELQTIEVHLADEIPKFHSGRRIVTVLSIGPKWVRLRCGNKTARIPRGKWVEILTHKNNRNLPR